MTAPAVALSRTVLRAIPFRWWQPGKVAPVDCTGMNCVVADTTLPWTPAIAAIDLALGKFELAAPTAPQAALLVLGRRYALHVVLRTNAGVPVDEFRCAFEAV